MKIRELVKSLKKFNQNAEVELAHCWSENCPVRENGGDCDNKGCQYAIFDVINVDNCDSDEKPKDAELVTIWIDAVNGWEYDDEGNEILQN